MFYSNQNSLAKHEQDKRQLSYIPFEEMAQIPSMRRQGIDDELGIPRYTSYSDKNKSKSQTTSSRHAHPFQSPPLPLNFEVTDPYMPKATSIQSSSKISSANEPSSYRKSHHNDHSTIPMVDQRKSEDRTLPHLDRTSLPANFERQNMGVSGELGKTMCQPHSRHGLADYQGNQRPRSRLYSPPPPPLQLPKRSSRDRHLLSSNVEYPVPVPPVPPLPPVPKVLPIPSSKISRASESTSMSPTSSLSSASHSIVGSSDDVPERRSYRNTSRGSNTDSDDGSEPGKHSRGHSRLSDKMFSRISPSKSSTSSRSRFRLLSRYDSPGSDPFQNRRILSRLALIPAKEAKAEIGSAVPKSANRRRGKTLPSSLAPPIPVPSVPLPPLKLERISAAGSAGRRPSVQNSPTNPSTPTRIPVPMPRRTSFHTDTSNSNGASPSVSSKTSRRSLPKLNLDKASTSRSSRSLDKSPAVPHTALPKLPPPYPDELSVEDEDEAGIHYSATRKLSMPTLFGKHTARIPEKGVHALSPERSTSTHPNIESSTTSRSVLRNKTARRNLLDDDNLSLDDLGIYRSDRTNTSDHTTPARHTFTSSSYSHYSQGVPRSRHSEDHSKRSFMSPSELAKSSSRFSKAIEKRHPSGGARTPRSAQSALRHYMHHLSRYEQTEILDYSNVYFVGTHVKKNPAQFEYPEHNFGYDDENGDYRIIIHDHLAYRYEVLRVLGRGSFGQVVECFDHKTGTHVAVKLIRNRKRFHAQALTEVKILQRLLAWDPEDKHHMVRMTDYFHFRNHICITCECLGVNLYDFLKSNHFQGLSLSKIRRISIQLLQALTVLYDHRLVHCDLKPENILFKDTGSVTIKVIDFGSSCLESERVYTYIQSRFYRSPEVILGMNYNMSIDMWSLGCILAELYTGIPLFPGENEQEQLACIMELLGLPPLSFVEQGSRRKLFFDSLGNPRLIPNSRGKKRRPGTKSLAHVLRCHDAQFIDFIQLCLEWYPERRMQPREALQHPWILEQPQHRHRPESEYNATLSQKSASSSSYQYYHSEAPGSKSAENLFTDTGNSRRLPSGSFPNHSIHKKW